MGQLVYFGPNLTPFSLQRSFDSAVAAGVELVVVDNTHTQRWEYANYAALGQLAGYRVRVEEAACPSRESGRRVRLEVSGPGGTPAQGCAGATLSQSLSQRGQRVGALRNRRPAPLRAAAGSSRGEWT